MSTQYRVGEVVDITIRGARVTEAGRASDTDTEFVSVVHGTFNNVVTVDLDPSVTVTRVAPPEWPPRPGDLWRDGDKRLWFVTYGATGLTAQTTARDCVQSRELLDRLPGPLTLVHREPDGDGAR